MNARMVNRALCGLALGYALACSEDQQRAGRATGGSSSTHPPKDASVGDGTCTTDPLRTNLIVEQTGVAADAYDCEILKYSDEHNEPDPMIFKAIIYVESRFNYTAVGCPNACPPCPDGWSTDECGCCGLMQSIAPSCSWDQSNVAFLPNGHPNLQTDPSASDWAGSAFNPDVNIGAGIRTVASNRVRMQQKYSGCTQEQYTLMSIGEFNHYGSTQSCTVYNTDYDTAVLEAYHRYSAAANYAEHSYP